MKQPPKPKQPHEYSPGPLAIVREGFWAFHQGQPFDPSHKHKTGSTTWNLYRKGYVWARLHPSEIPDWAYSSHRAMRKALECAIKWSKQIATGDNRLTKSNLEALRKAWERCLLYEVWIPSNHAAKSERVTTVPGSKSNKLRGKGGSG